MQLLGKGSLPQLNVELTQGGVLEAPVLWTPKLARGKTTYPSRSPGPGAHARLVRDIIVKSLLQKDGQFQSD